jgi:bacillithiol biosynthesis cysteine-adding enzyme BshC
MEILEISLPATNRLATDYIEGSFPLKEGFHYDIRQTDAFQQRVQHLQQRTYPRQQLVRHLFTYHKKFGASEQTMKNIEKLLHSQSVVVIGGQQAGLLTGPLYTIHKIISILTLARQQEKELGIPVVPMFWIASEDHDFAEVNHVYVSEKGKVEKKVYPHLLREKKMVAHIPLDHSACQRWIEEVVKTYGETDVTNEMLSFLNECLQQGRTVADFFAAIILRLFAKEGLVVVDAAHPSLREIERECFAALIDRHEAITDAVLTQQRHLEMLGYKRMIEIAPTCANLFYHQHDERLLLHYDAEQQQFYTKDGSERFTMEQLLTIAENEPHRLSNNVVTRPLMQEFLFPTLAFIAGPGEIAYWAELKQAFSLFGWNMPPVIPRLTFTFVERSIATDLRETGMSVEEVLKDGTKQAMEKWLEEQMPIPLADIVADAKKEIERIHQSLREIGLQVDASLEPVLLKNAALIQSQIDFLHQAIERKIVEKHEVHLWKFRRVELSLKPNGLPQERVWNIFYYINKYGFDFLERWMGVDYRWNGKHKIVFI